MTPSRLCAALLLAAASSAGWAQEFQFPAVSDATSQEFIRRFQADWAQIKASPAYFSMPSSAPGAPAVGCAVDKAELYKAAGLIMALPEEAAKIAKMTRKQLRDIGMDADQALKPMQFLNVQMVPLAVPCKGGKPDGEVEVMASYDTLMATRNQMNMGQKMVTMTMEMRQVHFKRARALFADGAVRRVLFSADRFVSDNRTTYDDPATQEMISKHAVPPAKEPSTILLYQTDQEAGPMVTFMVMPEPKFSAGLFGVNYAYQVGLTTMFSSGVRPQGASSMKSRTYKGATLTMEMEMPMRDAKPHGEQIIRMENYLKKNNLRPDQVPGMENARFVMVDGVDMIEQRNCYIDGNQVKTTNCPKD